VTCVGWLAVLPEEESGREENIRKLAISLAAATIAAFVYMCVMLGCRSFPCVLRTRCSHCHQILQPGVDRSSGAQKSSWKVSTHSSQEESFCCCPASTPLMPTSLPSSPATSLCIACLVSCSEQSAKRIQAWFSRLDALVIGPGLVGSGFFRLQC
jgi:hypothetical protein